MHRSYNHHEMEAAFADYPEMYDPGFDYEGWVSDHRNLMFVEGRSVGLMTYDAPGVYCGHMFFHVHGAEALDLARRIIKETIELHGAKVIKGLTPVSNKKALFFSRRLGFESLGEVEGVYSPCVLFYMTADDYYKRNEDVALMRNE